MSEQASREPKWWEWVEQNWHDLVEWVKQHIDPNQPNPPGPPPVPTPTPTPTPLPPSSGTIAWVNTDSAVSDADVETWVLALNQQVPDISALWPHVQEWAHVFVASTRSAPVGALLATIKPELPEAPGALAYHDVDPAGKPYIVVGSQTCIQAGVSVSSAMSHEATELTVDPGCQATATAPDGKVWALEVADPVESDSYNIGSVQVSDFVGQAFFGMGAGVLDKTGASAHAFSISPGGYAVINGKEVFGEKPAADAALSKQLEARRRNVQALGQKGTPRRPSTP